MLWDTIVALVAVALVVIVFWKLPDDEEWEEQQAEGTPAPAGGPSTVTMPAAPQPGGGATTVDLPQSSVQAEQKPPEAPPATPPAEPKKE